VGTLEQERTYNQRAGLVVLAVLVAVAALWATTALAAGGSSSGAGSAPSGDGPGTAYIQDRGDGARGSDGARGDKEDCPNRGGSNALDPSSDV
jgi:hypothetical protein